MLPANFDLLPGRKPFVSLIIPTLNEGKNLPLVLPYIPTDVVDEVILVDGRSDDDTIEIARQLLPNIKLVMEPKPGKGAALRRGYAEASGDILVVLDADGSHDPREIPRYIKPLIEGADFVKGSRFAPTGGTTDMPRLRKAGNWAFTQIVNLLFAQSFTDLCYGFHAFRRHCLDYLDLGASDGFEVDTAIYLQAVRNNLKVAEVPSFEGLRFYGMGKLNTFPDGWRVLRTIFSEWAASRREPLPEPLVGFRGNYNLRSVPVRTAVPVTGSAIVVDAPKSTGANQLEQKPCSLDEFFSEHLPEMTKDDVDLLLPQVLLDVMERLGASGGSLAVLDEHFHNGSSIQAFGRKAELVPVQEMDKLLRDGIAGWAIQNRQNVLVQSTAVDDRWMPREWEREQGLSRSALVMPLFNGDQVSAVFVLTRPEERPFNQDDLRRMNEIEIIV